MVNALRTLFTSKRVMVAVVTALFELALALGWIGQDLDPSLVDQLATWIGTIGLALIGAISVTDAAKAIQLPPGVGHKDEVLR